jgi:hypothetical protein
MIESSRKTKIAWVVLCLGLAIWGLTDVRQRAHFDPVLAAEDRRVIMKHRTDLTVYTEAGAAFFDGRDPYGVTNPRGWMYLYPPLFAILMAPLHALPPQWQGVFWYFLSLAMAWGCYRESVRLLRHAQVSEFTSREDSAKKFRWIQVAAVAAILIPTLDCLQRGQVGILILYLLLLGLRLVMEGDSWQKTVVGGLVLSLSIVFKIIPALPVFFLLFLLIVPRMQKTEGTSRSFRFLGAGAGVLAGLFLFFFVVPSIFIGWQSNTAHLKTWSRMIGDQAVATSVEAHFSNPRGPRNQSLSNALYHTGNQVAFWVSGRSEPNPWRYNDTAGRFMNSPTVTKTILAVRVLLVLLLIPLAWKRSGSPLDRLAAFGLACAAMLMVSPVARGHYFMLELPAVLFVSLWVWKYKGPSKAVLCASIPATLSILHYVFITYPQMFGPLKTGTLFMGTLGIGTALWYMAMTYILVRFTHTKTAIATGTESSE